MKHAVLWNPLKRWYDKQESNTAVKSSLIPLIYLLIHIGYIVQVHCTFHEDTSTILLQESARGLVSSVNLLGHLYFCYFIDFLKESITSVVMMTYAPIKG